MYDVFFSYSHKDKTFVHDLARKFEGDGIQTFVDEMNIAWGGSIPRELEEALDNSRHIICVLSPDYLSSNWGQMERYAALIDDPDGFLGKLLPIMLRDVQLPRLLRPLRYLDCRDSGALDKLYPEMVRHLLRKKQRSPAQLVGKDAAGTSTLTPPGYVLVVGNPAAGKSTFCRLLRDELISQGFGVERRSDYPFLQALYRLDLARGPSQRFVSDPISEFKVIDPIVYDEALKLIHDELIVTGPQPGNIIIIEFSRPSYDTAFLHYTLKALIDSAIVHVEAPLALCHERNEKRKAALELRLAGASHDSDIDVFADEPDLHYTPPRVFDRYGSSAASVDQSLVLALMPARRYYRINNVGRDLAKYRKDCRDLIVNHIVNLLDHQEDLVNYHRRRLDALASFLDQATGR